MGICDYRHTLVNLIIALEGILLLTDGAHRQRFYEVYSECKWYLMKSLVESKRIKN